MGANTAAWNGALGGLGNSFVTVNSMNRQSEQDRLAKEEREAAKDKEAERLRLEKEFLDGQYGSSDDAFAAAQKHNQLGTASYNAIYGHLGAKERAAAEAAKAEEQRKREQEYLEAKFNGVDTEEAYKPTDEEFAAITREYDEAGGDSGENWLENHDKMQKARQELQNRKVPAKRAATKDELAKLFLNASGMKSWQAQSNKDRDYDLNVRKEDNLASDRGAKNAHATAALEETVRNHKAQIALKLNQLEAKYAKTTLTAEQKAAMQAKINAYKVELKKFDNMKMLENVGGEKAAEALKQTIMGLDKMLNEDMGKQQPAAKQPPNPKGLTNVKQNSSGAWVGKNASGGWESL